MDLNNISIKGRLLGSNIVICLLLVALNAVVFTSISTMEKTSEWVEHTEEVIVKSKGLVNSMVNQETGLRGFAIAGQEDYLEPYFSGKEDFKNYFQTAKGLTFDNPAQQTRFDEVADQAQSWSNYAESIIALRKDIRNGEEINTDLEHLIESGIGKQQMDSLRVEIDKLNYVDLGSTLLSAMINMETGLRGFMLNREEGFLEPYLASKKTIKQEYSAIAGSKLAQNIDSWINDYAEKAIGLVRESNRYKTMADLYTELDKKKGKIYMDDLRSKVSAIIDIA